MALCLQWGNSPCPPALGWVSPRVTLPSRGMIPPSPLPPSEMLSHVPLPFTGCPLVFPCLSLGCPPLSPCPRVPPQGDIGPELLRQEDPDAQGTTPDTQCHPKATKFLGGDLGSPLALGSLSPACTPCMAALGGSIHPGPARGGDRPRDARWQWQRRGALPAPPSSARSTDGIQMVIRV